MQCVQCMSARCRCNHKIACVDHAVECASVIVDVSCVVINVFNSVDHAVECVSLLDGVKNSRLLGLVHHDNEHA